MIEKFFQRNLINDKKYNQYKFYELIYYSDFPGIFSILYFETSKYCFEANFHFKAVKESFSFLLIVL